MQLPVTPVDGVKRPMTNGNEGSTPALGAVQARKLLEAPAADTLKGVRDRAILATLLYHGMPRRALRLKSKRPAQPTGRHAFSRQRQAIQNPLHPG
jgi:integrase/recombinase XerD